MTRFYHVLLTVKKSVVSGFCVLSQLTVCASKLRLQNFSSGRALILTAQLSPPSQAFTHTKFAQRASRIGLGGLYLSAQFLHVLCTLA